MDVLAQWLIAPLFIVFGLSLDRPEVAYQSLIWPEVAVVLLIGRSLRSATEHPVGFPWPAKGHVR